MEQPERIADKKIRIECVSWDPCSGLMDQRLAAWLLLNFVVWHCRFTSDKRLLGGLPVYIVSTPCLTA